MDALPSHDQILGDLRKLAAATIAEMPASVNVLPPDQIEPATRLTGLGFDSIAAAGFVIEIESFYGISLPPLLLFHCNTVSDLIEQISELLRGAGRA